MSFAFSFIIISSNYKRETKETSYLLFALEGKRKCFVQMSKNVMR